MSEELKNTDIGETSSGKASKNTLKKVLKVLAWIAGVWLAILVILQVALSPSVLTKVVNRFAAEYVDGDLSFGKVRLAMFRHFPNIGISMDDCSLTYPAERFDSLETAGAQGLLLYKGCGEISDTLASFEHFSAGINVGALITGKISIPHIILVKPRIFAHSYDAENANWNILRTGSDEDTTSASLPPISIGKIRLTKHPHIVYTDSQDTLFAMIDVRKMAFDGRIDTKKASRNKIGFSIDSLILAGRLAEDTVGFRLSQLHIHEHHKHLDIHAKADAAIATRSFGRMNIPVSIQGSASFPKDTVPALEISGCRIEIADIPVELDGKLRRTGGHTGIDGNFRIDNCKVQDAIDGFLENIVPEAGKVRTDAVISLTGSCKGELGNGHIPSLSIELDVPDSEISHKDIAESIRIALTGEARTDEEDKINIDIKNLKLAAEGLEVSTKGRLTDLLGEDPSIGIDGRLEAELGSLVSLLPDTEKVKAGGRISADLDGSIKLSQLSIYNFAQADLEGYIVCDSLLLDSPEDTINLRISGMDFRIGPESKTSRMDTTRTFKLLAVTGRIKEADATYKDVVSFKGKAIDLAAKNAAEAFSDGDTTKVHPLGGHLNATSLSLTDADGLSLSMDNTANRFQMVPKKGHPDIPVLSISSTNKRIFVRDLTNRFILTDASVQGKAAMNTVERRQRRKALMDSLALVYPDVPNDSLFRHYISTRRDSIRIPEWMKEEDFKKQDINISLDESLARYFREWDLDGDIKVRTGILMTPHFPLRNILRGMDISFNNNEFKIDSLKFLSGESEIAAKGSLTGLRRALLGRGTYKLDMAITSGKMNADELLAAFNAGAAFNPDTVDMSDASDSEFLKMVVADSLSAEQPQKLLVVPANLNAEISLNAKNIAFSGLEINSLEAKAVMKERCMQILNTSVTTNVGNGSFEGFYATRTKQDIRTGFNLGLTDITTEKVISMMPAIDTIMPLLKSFKGLVDCELAATASLDTTMNVIMPSINGVIRIGGENLSLSGEKVFTDLAKKLKFKDKNEGKIDKMTVEGIIKDNTLEVFPFILDIDRYTLALSGKHNLDQSFRYHVSMIRSPMVFKVGIDLYGPDFGNMKFKIGKPKYKNTKVPVFTEVIDRTRINLAESIRGIFEKGVDAAVKENERQEAIEEHKKSIGYVNAVDQQLEELSDDEKKQIEEAENADSQDIENTIKETPDTLNEQSGIH